MSDYQLFIKSRQRTWLPATSLKHLIVKKLLITLSLRLCRSLPLQSLCGQQRLSVLGNSRRDGRGYLCTRHLQARTKNSLNRHCSWMRDSAHSGVCRCSRQGQSPWKSHYVIKWLLQNMYFRAISSSTVRRGGWWQRPGGWNQRCSCCRP